MLGLPTADKAAAACLSSRFAYGVAISAEGLARVEAAEDSLTSLGFEIVRVRDLGNDVARVEVSPEMLGRARSQVALIDSAVLQAGFREVSIDERGYRQGAMNEMLQIGGRIDGK